MVQKLAWGFGIVLTLVGILGFVPGVTSADGLLLGIFQVDALHNVVHLLTGVLAIVAALGAGTYSRLFFQVFGVVYALVTIVGFVQGNTVLGLFPVNMADNVLHILITVFALWAGFMVKDGSGMRSADAM